MKKSVLCLLLAMLMCLSVFFVSCDKDDKAQQDIANAPSEETSDTPETPKVDVAKGKAVLVEYLKANDLSSIDMSFEFDKDEYAAMLEEVLSSLECGGEASAILQRGEETGTVDLDLALKNGLVYAGAEMAAGEDSMQTEVYMLFRGLEMLGFEKDETGEWFLAANETIELPTDSVNPEQLSAIAELLKLVDFEEVTKDDIAYENELFVVKNHFWAEIFTEIMLASEGITDADIDEEAMAEAVAEIQKMLDALNLEIGFEISSNEVSKMVLAIDADAETMAEFDIIPSGINAHVKATITFRLMDQGKTLKGMSANIDFYEEDEMDLNLLFDANLIYKEKQPIGMDMKINGTMKNVMLDYMYTEDEEGNIIGEYDILGDTTFSAKMMMNLGAGEGKDLFTLDFSNDTGNIRATNGEAVEKESYEQAVAVELAVKLETLTKLAITADIETMTYGEKIGIDASAALYLDTAPNFPTEIPEIIQGYLN